MSAAEDVARHIHGSLLDLRRRVDTEVAIEVARAVVEGATRALEELSEDLDRASKASTVQEPMNSGPSDSVKH